MTGAIIPTSSEMNYVVVNGVQSPGRVQLNGVEAPYNWQIQEGYGLSGAFCIFRGRGIAKPTITIEMWLPEHFVQWALFKETLKPPTLLKPFFVQMQHPLLASADINSVGVESLGEPMRSPSGGMWVATIKLLEYRPLKLSLVKPDKTIPGVDKGPLITPETEGDIQLVKAQAGLEAAMVHGRVPGK